jgi:hypothetical protein
MLAMHLQMGGGPLYGEGARAWASTESSAGRCWAVGFGRSGAQKQGRGLKKWGRGDRQEEGLQVS